MVLEDKRLFDALGFHWNRSVVAYVVPTHSIERVCFRFHRMLPEFVWDASVLEGNPFTFPEVKTLLDGVTIGGRKISDQEQILNLAESAKRLLRMVKSGSFVLDKGTFADLHSIVARNEALEWGVFRGEGKETNYTPDVGLGEHGRYTPLPTLAGAPALNRVFSTGLQALESDVPQPFEKAAAFFMFGALQQFFFDGNKRTSRFMMNGTLMAAGIDAISVPAAKAQEFNEKMVQFYLTKDATEMMTFLVGCHPEASQIYEANPMVSGAWRKSLEQDKDERERDRRIAELHKLERGGGASYTFWRLANEASKGVGGQFDRVNWSEVEQKTIAVSIGEHGQSPDGVGDALCEHSPGAVSPARQMAIRSEIKSVAPGLQATYVQLKKRDAGKGRGCNPMD